MIKKSIFVIASTILLPAIALPAAASAQEVFGGLAKHNVGTPLTLGDGLEGGFDLQLGWRAGRIIRGTGLQPYVFGSLNTRGETSFVAAGVGWTLGRRFYVRPGIGLAIHNGSAGNRDRSDRIAFGSRILFEPEIAVGTRVNDRLSIEASWVHLSHAQLFGRQNPGIDNIGARINLKL